MISTLRGDDSVESTGGSDTVCGGPGHDSVNSGSGADTILGGDGNDYLYPGDDTAGDVVSGEGGNDYVYGAGSLSVGKSATVVLLGGPGNDHVFTATDFVPSNAKGGLGDDWLWSYGRTVDVIDGEAGYDRCFYSPGDTVRNCEEVTCNAVTRQPKAPGVSWPGASWFQHVGPGSPGQVVGDQRHPASADSAGSCVISRGSLNRRENSSWPVTERDHRLTNRQIATPLTARN